MGINTIIQMKNITFFLSAGCLFGLLALAACHRNDYALNFRRERSPKTGMHYGDKKNGNFSPVNSIKKVGGPGLIAIEGGSFVMGGSLDQDLGYDYDNLKRRVTVASFYMDETEVSNRDWLEYLHWIRTNFPGDEEYYHHALPDTLVWRKPLSYNEPYVNNYLRHPGFGDYPVVGVTWEQANEYASWRTDRVNENILREKQYLSPWKQKSRGTTAITPGTGQPFNTDIYLNGQIKDEGKAIIRMNKADKLPPGTTSHIGLEHGVLVPGYRLPTEAEWEYAALALAGNTESENIRQGKTYPWNGLGVRSTKRKTRGMILANFKRSAGDNMGVGGYLNDKYEFTGPVASFVPNDFGLYNMAGNVNEWVRDVYRKLSFEDFEDYNPFRGNEFVNKRLEDKDHFKYAKDKYGRPILDPAVSGKKQKWSELTGTSSDTSSAALKTDAAFHPSIAGKPYNPDFRGHLDTANQSLYGVTTLVNNRSRVYKGGSWNDRAHWLNPATRRFQQQDESSAEIGFRCAMDKLGDAEISKKGKPHFATPTRRAER